jgi:glycosyltransferase involved in cell wall biosynthesis
VTLLTLAFVSFVLALFNALLFLRNYRIYLPPPEPNWEEPPSVSILIPARNEELVIRQAVESALASAGINLEVIVLDDNSDDHTAEIVRSLSAVDSRVRLKSAPPLPPGWCGKQFACSVLSALAQYDILCFIDSDVRLQPGGVARMVSFLQKGEASLVSGFPHQELQTFFEKLLLPLMHFLLLSFLPIDIMRRWTAPSLAAGCGQIFVADRTAYRQAGGHAAIRASRHDGIALPKAFRRAGLQTDLCDATSVADCRMYRSAGEVFSGLLKNANEGIAAPIRIFVFSLLLGLGHIVPFLLPFSIQGKSSNTHLIVALCFIACALSVFPRILAALRYRQPLFEAFLHPFAIFVFLSLQWWARFRDLAGTPAVWKGRSYQTT